MATTGKRYHRPPRWAGDDPTGGVALGPPLAFLLADWLGLRANYGLTALVLLAVGSWFVLAWRRE